VALCGDGDLDGLEECDDGNIINGDGCAGNCTVEPGKACAGTPSLCFSTCGNNAINDGEQCDDGNTVSGDGCGVGCLKERGWVCSGAPSVCENFHVFIDTPTHGVFTTAGTVLVTGHYTTLPPGQVSVTVNGVPASSLNQTARTFSHTVTLNQAQVLNPVLVSLTNTASGENVRERVVVIAGESVPDGSFSTQAGAFRMNDSGLDTVEPLVGGLAAGQFDIGSLISPGALVADECFIHFIGCLGSARVTIANPPPSVGDLSIALDSKTNAVYAAIDIANLRVDVNINGSGLVPNCGLRMRANVMHLNGDYAMEPKAGSPSNVDVNLVSPITAGFTNFSTTFTSGICTWPIIGDIIQAVLPDVSKLAGDGIKGFLADPDGAGPLDSPIADGIETALAGISISGPVGEGVSLTLDAPLFAVNEDSNGITLGADLKFTTSIGNGPGQCIPPVEAPDLVRSFSKFEPFPAFGTHTPSGKPYGLGICISSAGFNQLLRGQTECGLMRSSLTSIDLDGDGPLPALTIDSSLLSALIPEFGQLPPGTPLRIDVYPTLAPLVTGNDGPQGAVTELKIGQMIMEIVDPSTETVWLTGGLDVRLGMDLAFLPDGSGLAITITTPQASDITIAVIENPLGANQVHVETVLPGLIQPLIPGLAGALSGFPLPQFFGLTLQGVEVERNGQFISLFANLATGQ
jgi:cysteine-rich repeat protein